MIPDFPQGSGVRNSSLLVIDETDDVIRVTHIPMIEAGSCKWVDYVYPREEGAGKELKGREADGGGGRQREQDGRRDRELSGAGWGLAKKGSPEGGAVRIEDIRKPPR